MMAVSWLLLINLGLSVFKSNLVTAEFPTTRELRKYSDCTEPVNLGDGAVSKNWRRLVFPGDAQCFGSFYCMLHIKNEYPSYAVMCWDYSRMRLHGANTKMVMYDKDGDYVQSLSDTRYPMIETYMDSLTCKTIPPGEEMRIDFKAICDQREPLDDVFAGWSYVYLQAIGTGTHVYYLDGNAKHKLRFPKDSLVVVNVRSKLWRNSSNEKGKEKSTLRLSTPWGKRCDICYTFEPPLYSVIPPGVQLRIFKTYLASSDKVKAKTVYLSLNGGDMVTSHFSDCHYMSDVYDIVFEVTKDVGFVPVIDGQDLFSLTVKLQEKVKKELTTTARSLEIDTHEEEETEGGVDIWKIVMGTVVPLSICCGCCCGASKKKNNDESDDAESQADQDDANSRPQTEGFPNNNAMTTDIPDHPPESISMLPVQPTAPWQGLSDQDAPPSYDSAGGCPPPPDYKDLFPEH